MGFLEVRHRSRREYANSSLHTRTTSSDVPERMKKLNERKPMPVGRQLTLKAELSDGPVTKVL